ncbi:MAG TPA: hypothetical protein VJN42_01535 [Candidatus Acidoferrum sp.]|nr:hypothetical protein [Candidatus Acidoferrum sp.]
MFKHINKVRFCALLLGMVFLAAQFHFCADLNSGPVGSHPCQLCSTAGAAVAPSAISLAVIPVVHRLEVLVPIFAPALEVSRATSPRAPPAL